MFFFAFVSYFQTRVTNESAHGIISTYKVITVNTATYKKSNS
jgi:hypothetical protein